MVRGGDTVSTLSGVEMSTGVGLAWGKSLSMHACWLVLGGVVNMS